ncbi:hypothetical protein [Streptacidiphilus rugosus]|uniref:hypothetical protein n=1 Tax=Streptacidiphilus rugosus TaxID=405783 RepID=UPI001E336D2B|nr:hypothetical protein [Streptacidiphilus rugosus]
MEQRVIAHFTLGGAGFGDPEQRKTMFEAEKRLRALVAEASVGAVDGNEYGGGRVALYAYGADADALFAAMETELRAVPFRPAHVYVVYSDDSSRRVDL